MASRRFFYASLGILVLSISLAVVFGTAERPAAAAEELDVGLAEKLQEEFAAVAAKVNPTVVSIDVTAPATVRRWRFRRPGDLGFPTPPGFEEFFESPYRRRRPRPGPGEPEGEAPVRRGVGSGVIIDAAGGYVLTNNHVVARAKEIGVTLIDGTRVAAEIVGTDPRTDLAVIRIEAKGLKEIEWGDSDKLKVGHWVLAFGQPEGLRYTVTRGIVSAKGRANLGIIGRPGGITAYEDFIQTDAAINPGNSGGPLTNIRGRLVGINTAIAIRGAPSFLGIGFAVPSNMAREVSRQLIEAGEVVRGWLGVSIADFEDLHAKVRKPYGKDVKGAFIGGVEPGQPAEEAGIKAGDVIVSYGGKKVTDSSVLRSMVADTPVGDRVAVEVLRIVDDEPGKVAVTVEIAKQPADLAEATGAVGVLSSDVGISVQTLTGEMARAFGYGDETGAVVTEIKEGSRAAAADIRPGDLIKEVRYKGEVLEIESARDFAAALSKVPKEQGFVVTRKRGGKAKFVAIK